MKLSEAIRVGSFLKPQTCDGYYFDDRDGTTCALGAAMDAIGLPLKDDKMDFQHEMFVRYPFLHRLSDCPGCSRITNMVRRWKREDFDIEDVINHLNDYHWWTRARIADWVDTIEPNQQQDA